MQTEIKSFEEEAADKAVSYMILGGGILMGEYDAHLKDIIDDCRQRASIIFDLKY